jgi:alpha-mannosidase
VDVTWLEIGSAQAGVPMLRAAFPLALQQTTAVYEIPGGSVTRSSDPREVTGLSGAQPEHSKLTFDPYPGEVPALRWADLSGTHASGAKMGATLLNESKYGHNVDGNVLRLTLLRSSYQPDPLPELGRHRIRFALQLHDAEWSPSLATRWGYDYNQPFNVVNTPDHPGDLPLHLAAAELLTPNVMLSALKKAEDDDALIVRLYEMEGNAVTAQLRLSETLAAPNAPAVETDLLEQPLARNTARMTDGMLQVDIPAHGIATIKLGGCPEE